MQLPWDNAVLGEDDDDGQDHHNDGQDLHDDGQDIHDDGKDLQDNGNLQDDRDVLFGPAIYEKKTHTKKTGSVNDKRQG